MRLSWRSAAALTALALLAGAVAFGLWRVAQLRASVAVLDGEVTLAGLENPVTIDRDAKGTPTVRAGSRLDLARAVGFLHGQDRFFQMDLLRRTASGELAELFGRPALAWDRRVRPHRFAAQAVRNVESWPEEMAGLAEAYAEGVNAGLAALGPPPPEYLFLGLEPRPWRAEDVSLSVHALHLILNSEHFDYESSVGILHETLPADVADFLAPVGTRWDAPIDASSSDPPVEPPPLPAFHPEPDNRVLPAVEPAVSGGSNAWAVAGRLTRHGGALVGGDPHLELRVPNSLYRVTLEWEAEDGRLARAVGVTFPGSWGLLIGSNETLAWSLTTAYADDADWVLLEPDPADPDRAYRTPDGPRRFETFEETIAVRGGAPETVEVRWTVWGPVMGRDHAGRERALRWVAHDLEGVRPHVLDLMAATSLDELIELASRSGMPPHNIVAGDRDGHIAWTVAGRLPVREGLDGRTPASWADGERGWRGLLDPEETPRIVDPPTGRLWSANGRMVSGEALAKLGDGRYALGARQRQIRDALLADDRFEERDFLAIQLDDRAIFLESWRERMLETANRADLADDPKRAELRRVLIEGWTGRASIDSTAYPAVRQFRTETASLVFSPLVDPAVEAAPGVFNYLHTRQWEGPLERLLIERPANALNPRFPTWDDLLLAAFDRTAAKLAQGDPPRFPAWGETNRLTMRHPMSPALPFAWMRERVDMTPDALPGDQHMPRVQSPTRGASIRMAVAPGREQDGILQIAGGPSGHPFSPYYEAGREAWLSGEPAPLEPGPAEHTVRLVPDGASVGSR